MRGSNDELALGGCAASGFHSERAVETDGDDGRKTVRQGRLAGTASVKNGGSHKLLHAVYHDPVTKDAAERSTPSLERS